jgi:glycosyltransferase 2 family protein
LTKKQLVVGFIVFLLLIGLGIYAQYKNPIDWQIVFAQFATADWLLIAISVACIYLAYVFRSIRWACLLRHNKSVPLLSLLSTQIIGFTAVALIGRVADPVRPYLVSKKTGLPVSNQIAVYVVERLFDAGAMALIFSSTILFSTWFGGIGAMPHPERVQKSGLWAMIFTVAGALFLVTVRFAGRAVASLAESVLGALSKKLGQAVGAKIIEFHAGLDTMRSFRDFATAAGLSVGMWLLIAASYLETMRAFVADPVLSTMTPAKCVLLMVVSGVSSIVQLPVIGWFTQIFVVKEAISRFFDVAQEPALACATTLLLVSFLSIVPVGLIWAQFENISLRKLAHESEAVEAEAGKELDPSPAPTTGE